MNREKMEEILNETTEKDLPYIMIPSYNRPRFVTGKKILPLFSKKALERVFIFVRDEQYKEYRKENPKLQIIGIPKGEVSGVGSTRRFILDYAIKSRWACAMDMDDDIRAFQFLYDGVSSSGKPCSSHSNMSDWKKDPRIPQKVLQLAGKIAREVFLDNPTVLLGNIRKQRLSHKPNYASIKYQINREVTPRQTKILNVKGIYKAGVNIPKAFNLHGDDIGFVAEVLQYGYDCFTIPCLCYDYIDDKVDSVVRDPHNPEKNRHLHKLEYDALMKMEIKDYLRETFKFPDGQYMFGDVDWRKYHKLHGTKPIIKYW